MSNRVIKQEETGILKDAGCGLSLWWWPVGDAQQHCAANDLCDSARLFSSDFVFSFLPRSGTGQAIRVLCARCLCEFDYSESSACVTYHYHYTATTLLCIDSNITSKYQNRAPAFNKHRF
ncbi:hypothetical protein LSTR_LSTR004616 [Laodelphax striatellus]|uniref:Uncharacterized protein n=1 Tax=Laodelphax striatellus TaxID=195883 RepID=A0A482WTX6_LAOST|nr:hypothetical protein LSTR_LSTR004616 [Laodelphax striatellus]